MVSQLGSSSVLYGLMLGLGLLVFYLGVGLVYAHGDNIFSEAEEIIRQKISCDDLTDDQLEILGDYYMEQMHPGEMHEIMDERMGGEGSDSLRQMHINMGLAFYCGEHGAFSGGMMDAMMGRNMMDGYYQNSRVGAGILNWTIYFLVIAVLILLVVFFTRKLRNSRSRGKRK